MSSDSEVDLDDVAIAERLDDCIRKAAMEIYDAKLDPAAFKGPYSYSTARLETPCFTLDDSAEKAVRQGHYPEDCDEKDWCDCQVLAALDMFLVDVRYFLAHVDANEYKMDMDAFRSLFNDFCRVIAQYVHRVGLNTSSASPAQRVQKLVKDTLGWDIQI